MSKLTFKSILAQLAGCLSALLMLCLSSCDSMIYDDEGDCDPHYKVQFVFDHNLKFVDAFHAEVKAVTLYVVDDETGEIVWQKSESGEELMTGHYMMDVDVKPGKYTLLAWCGMGVDNHFDVAQSNIHTDLKCSLRRDIDADGKHSSSAKLDDLYHGLLTAQIFPDEQGTHTFTVKLIKNTNEVNILMQHLSGEPINHENYVFTITDDNGLMDYDNSLIDDNEICYYAHTKQSGVAGFDETTRSRTQTSISACVAQHKVGRLMADHKDRTMVTIWHRDGRKILSVPFIQYALMVKGSYSDLDDQEYLDRQDKYDLVFFLDQNDKWVDTYIYINSWKVVLQNVEI